MKDQEKAFTAFDKLIARIERGGRDKPPPGMLIPFSIFKYVSEIDKENMPADHEYYKDKTDYFYDIKIPFYQRFIRKRVVKKIVAGFE